MNRKKRLLLRRLVVMSLLMLLVMGMTVPAVHVAAQAGSAAAINTGRLNLRSGPGITFGIVTSAPYNTTVTLIGRASSGTWVQVQLANGVQGWVNRLYLRTYANYDLLPITYNTANLPPPQTVPPPGSGNTGTTVYVVRAGDTLKNIAARYGTTWQILAAVNNLINPNYIYEGQRLIIAYSAPAPNPNPSPNPGTGQTIHIVQAGETLQIIATRYGRTWQQIAAANNLANANQIYAGQRLVIPAAPRYYTVQNGDTLFSIALRYGVTVQAIMTANGLTNANYVYAGQRLTIP